MSELPDNSVHLAITSPPYWQLKDYGTENQIGFHDSYENYINNLNLVWKECYRVLHDGCRLCVNIGDQFARAVYYGRYKVIPIREEIIKFCENIGFDYMGAIIWQKVTTSNTTGGGVQMGSYPYPRNGILKLDYEFILVFKKLGDSPKPTKEQKELSKMSAEEWNTFFAGHWNFAGARQNNHIAMYPEELPRRLIKMFSFVGETILDPFVGSGTTALAAKNTERNSVGFEINPAFIQIIKEKLEVHQLDLNATTYEFVKQKKINLDFEKEIQKLPYIFKDPHITVKLIGVKEDPNINGKATSFLQEKIKGKRVFLKYDNVKHDSENNLLCYLYLENKTFINAHLIKSGFVKVDIGVEFKYKEKFQSLFNEVHAQADK